MEKQDTKMEHFVGMAKALKTMRERKKLTDIVLVCKHGGREFEYPAHKAVLAASSKYFDELLEDIPYEDKHYITGIPPGILEILIEFMYIGNLKITKETDIGTLLASAGHFQLHPAIRECTNFMLKRLTNENITELWKIAEDYQIEDMKNAILKHIRENFKNLAKSNSLAALPFEYMESLMKQRPPDCDPDDVFDACLHWIQCNEAARKRDGEELLNVIDISSLSSDYVMRASENPLILKNIGLMQMLFQEMSKRMKSFVSGNPQPPKRSSLPNVIPNVKDSTNDPKMNIQSFLKGVQTIKPLTTTQKTVAVKNENSLDLPKTNKSSLDLPKANMNIVASNKEIIPKNLNEYIQDKKESKDFDGRNILGFVKRQGGYNLVCLNMTQGTQINANDSIKSPLFSEETLPLDAAICVHGGKIYLMGGRDDLTWRPSKKTFVYDIQRKEWVGKADMNVARYATGCAVMNESLYVVGGINNANKRLATLECYDISSNNWLDLPPMSFGREHPAVSAFENQLYVIGGYGVAAESKYAVANVEPFASGEIYDPHAQQWTTFKTYLPIAKQIKEHRYKSLSVCGGIVAISVHAFGNPPEHHFYEYDIISRNWIKHKALDCNLKDVVLVGRCGDNICIVDEDGRVILYSHNAMKIVREVQLKCPSTLSYAVCVDL